MDTGTEEVIYHGSSLGPQASELGNGSNPSIVSLAILAPVVPAVYCSQAGLWLELFLRAYRVGRHLMFSALSNDSQVFTVCAHLRNTQAPQCTHPKFR